MSDLQIIRLTATRATWRNTVNLLEICMHVYKIVIAEDFRETEWQQ
jgi:hypothetical protein